MTTATARSRGRPLVSGLTAAIQAGSYLSERYPFSAELVNRREALLLAEFAPWYPGVRAEIWLPAERVAAVVHAQLEHGAPRWTPGTRILSDEHFEFRGGDAQRSRTLRTRRHDLG
jgi:hypothetical protein